MTKQQIYEQVVQLTAELAKTKVAEKIFDFAMNGEAVKAQMVIDCFPVYYPELYQKIVCFGEEFNKLIGNSKEDNEKFKKILQDCEGLMYGLAQTNLMAQIAQASETEDPTKIKEVIDTFRVKYSGLAENLINFQEEYTKYRTEHSVSYKGAIFGTAIDEENGVFVYDANVIDALSFYILNILGKIDEIDFFYDDEEGSLASIDEFITAIENATNDNFAEYVISYNILDWVKENEEKYPTVGELLVAALSDEFEDEAVEYSEE